MNLAELRDFCANLLDWDPSNATYQAQLDKLLNDAQTRVLSDYTWSFAQFDVDSPVYTDQTIVVTITNGSATITTTATFPYTSSTTLPGSPIDGAQAHFSDSGGNEHVYELAWISSTSTAYFTQPYRGITGTYEIIFRQRQIYLPSDTMTVMSVVDPSQGPVARYQPTLTRYEQDSQQYDREMLGTPTAYVPFSSSRIAAPRTPNGVATTAALAQGVRTIDVYMANVFAPRYPSPSQYPRRVGGGRESALSAVASYTLTAVQTLTFTPETLPNESGLYRRYYYTCAEAGIYAPVRVVGAVGSAAAGVDTVSPAGGVTLQPNLSLSYLQSQTAQTQLVRYVPSTGSYQGYELWPHPSSDRDMRVRVLRAAQKLLEDTDTPAIPEAYSQIIAYAAIEQLASKLGNDSLSQLYARKYQQLYGQMAAKYLSRPNQRIQRGAYQTDALGVANYYGPIVDRGNV